MNATTPLNEMMSIEAETARFLAGDYDLKYYHKYYNLTAIVVPGSLDGPRPGPYALMIGSLWLSGLCPRAWAAWVLDKEAEFALTKEEIEQRSNESTSKKTAARKGDNTSLQARSSSGGNP